MATVTVNEVHIRQGYLIDQISFVYSDGSEQHWGGQGGQESPKGVFRLRKGEFITKVIQRSGDSGGVAQNLDMVQFVTSIGRESPKYGNEHLSSLQPEMVASEGNQIFAVHRDEGRVCGAIDRVTEKPAPPHAMASTLKSWLETRGLEVLLPSLNAEDINDPEDLDGCGEKDLDIFLSSVKLSLGKKAVFRKAVASMGSKAEMDDPKKKIAEIKRSIVAMKDVPKYAGGNISEAAYKGAWHDVVRLIEAGADLRATFDYGAPALHHLASCPNLCPDLKQVPLPANLLMRLLLMVDADPNQGDDGGKAALHLWGKYGGSLEQGKVLIEFGADVNKEMNGGYTPLWYVRYYKYPAPDLWEQAAAMLVEAGAVQKPKSF